MTGRTSSETAWFTIADIERMVNVSRKTFTKWAEIQALESRRAEDDKRRVLYRADQIEALCRDRRWSADWSKGKPWGNTAPDPTPDGDGGGMGASPPASGHTGRSVRIEPNPELGQVGWHAVELGHLRAALRTALYERKIPILIGDNGSPLHHMQYVLADCLANHRNLLSSSLRAYSDVYALDLAAVRLQPDPAAVLGHEKFALAGHAGGKPGAQRILLLTSMEVLRDGDERLWGAIIDAARDQGGLLVCGVYDTIHGANPFLDERIYGPEDGAFGPDNVIPVRVRPYEPTATRELLIKWWYPQWLDMGWQFALDAFDSALRLRRHIEIHHRPKRLPYLAVDLGQSVVETAENEQALIVARSALEEVKRSHAKGTRALHEYEMAREAQPTEGDGPGHNDIEAAIASITSILKALAAARRDIEELIEDPVPRREDGAGLITRRHVIAQLMCPNDSHFVWPW